DAAYGLPRQQPPHAGAGAQVRRRTQLRFRIGGRRGRSGTTNTAINVAGIRRRWSRLRHRRARCAIAPAEAGIAVPQPKFVVAGFGQAMDEPENKANAALTDWLELLRILRILTDRELQSWLSCTPRKFAFWGRPPSRITTPICCDWIG